MEYVCFRRFKDNAICGKVNIPKGSLLYIDIMATQSVQTHLKIAMSILQEIMTEME